MAPTDVKAREGMPITQLGLSRKGISEQALSDEGFNFLRPQLITVPGAVIPYPYGGKQRQVMINMGQNQMQAKGVMTTTCSTWSLKDTLLKANNEDVKVVQELMRHANITTAMNIYTKALTPAKREAQSRVVDVLLDRSRNVEGAAESAA
jgi:integrase